MDNPLYRELSSIIVRIPRWSCCVWSTENEYNVSISVTSLFIPSSSASFTSPVGKSENWPEFINTEAPEWSNSSMKWSFVLSCGLNSLSGEHSLLLIPLSVFILISVRGVTGLLCLLAWIEHGEKSKGDLFGELEALMGVDFWLEMKSYVVTILRIILVLLLFW